MYEVLYEYLMIQDLNAMKLDWCEVGDARNAIVSYFYYPSRNCSIECLINHCSVQKKRKKKESFWVQKKLLVPKKF